MQILWVEDQFIDIKEHVDAVERRLEKDGGLMKYAQNIAEAMAVLDQQDFDLVILDMNLPLGVNAPDNLVDGDLNGKYVIEHLKTRGKIGTARILALTNFSAVVRGELGDVKDMTIMRKSSFRAEILKVIFDEPRTLAK